MLIYVKFIHINFLLPGINANFAHNKFFSQMTRFGTSIKVIIAYALLAAVLAVATWMVYDNSRTLQSVNNASEQLVKRRDVVDSLVCALLETSNAERAVLLGDRKAWARFDRSLALSAHNAARLRAMVQGRERRQRLDSLVVLMRQKRDNTMAVMDLLSTDSRDAFYRSKVEALQSGRDSVLIHPTTTDSRERHETVYEVVKTKRGFFRRLADAFRRQHTDTVGMVSIARTAAADTTGRDINIADSIASILTAIRHEEQQAAGRRHGEVAARLGGLQQVSLLLSRRTGQLLEDIQHDEHRALGRAVSRAMESRQAVVARIAVLGLLAILSAAVLVACILRDMKRERRDRRRIVEAKAETERVMQQRERLLLTITHDIKAPAASIAGFIELLGEYVDRPKARTCLDSMRHSAAHLQQLVAALLDYHLLESGKAELHESSFVPARLVERCVDEFRPMASGKGLRLTAQLPPDADGMWRADAFRIGQVLGNLVSNAVKYTDSGWVVVALQMSARRMVLTVSDSGKGISREGQERMFGAFTRLPGASGKEGVGLGLSIAREAVALLGGTIRVSSAEGKGTQFVVSLPVERESQAEGRSVSSRGEAVADAPACRAAGAAVGRAFTVLAVDDDALQLQLLAEMMGRVEGADVRLVTTGHAAEAVAMVQSLKPQVVFTDIEMPEMSGSAMLRQLDRSRVKVVAMTAHDQSIATQLLAEGFDACLFKPFSAATLAATLTQLTGAALRVKPAATCADPFAPLTAFAEGDSEAERDILVQTRLAVDDYIAMLSIRPTAESVAKAAHKAMPLLAMLRPDSADWLLPITPERIAATPPRQREELARRLADELKTLSRQLQERTEVGPRDR